MSECDYRIHEKCDGTLRGRKGTPHKVWSKDKGWHVKYACIECEMCFDED